MLLGSTTVTGQAMAVNPNGSLVYVSTGFGPGLSLVRVNASNPQAMTQVSLPNGGEVGVDPTTGRYATTNGYGDTLLVYNPDDTVYDTQSIQGCYGGFDADPATGRFFVGTQCNDHLIVYSEVSKAVPVSDAYNAVGGNVVFDPGTGNVFGNREIGNNMAQPLVLSKTYATSTPINGFVAAVNGVTGKLYVASNPPENTLQVMDSSTFVVLDTIAVSSQVVQVDTVLNRFYVVVGGSIQVYDGATDALLTAFMLPGGFAPNTMKMAIGDNRLYVLGEDGGTTMLFVFAT